MPMTLIHEDDADWMTERSQNLPVFNTLVVEMGFDRQQIFALLKHEGANIDGDPETALNMMLKGPSGYTH